MSDALKALAELRKIGESKEIRIYRGKTKLTLADIVDGEPIDVVIEQDGIKETIISRKPFSKELRQKIEIAKDGVDSLTIFVKG